MIIQNAGSHEEGLSPLWAVRRSFWQERRAHEVEVRSNPCWQVVRRIERPGWHLELHVDAADLGRIQGFVRESPVEVVIDHRGRVDAALGPLQAPFRTLIELVVRAPAVGLSSEVRFPKLDMLRIANQLRRAQHGKEAILILLQLRPLMRAVGILNGQVVEAKFFLDPQ